MAREAIPKPAGKPGRKLVGKQRTLPLDPDVTSGCTLRIVKSTQSSEKPPARGKHWRVGELADAPGLSVRALHYYEEIGLLGPPERTASGYRMYHEADVRRLQQICSLRQLGFSLEEIEGCLAQREWSPRRTIELHIATLRQEIAEQQALLAQLQALARYADTLSGTDGAAEAFLKSIAEMKRMEKYYTPEQLAELKQRAEALGAEKIHSVEAEWPQLIASMKQAMEQGKDPQSPEVQGLARRWQELIDMFTGSNPGIAVSLNNAYEGEPQFGAQMGLDAGLMAFVGKALGH
jgi:MerR family transcriptional regulator, thiopeptide resistance regulator